MVGGMVRHLHSLRTSEAGGGVDAVAVAGRSRDPSPAAAAAVQCGASPPLPHPMQCGATPPLPSPNAVRRDHGWIHTLLEEAENERMHLLTFLQARASILSPSCCC